MKLIYSPTYNFDLGKHSFRMEKYGEVIALLTATREIEELDIVTPEPASRDALQLVHDADYLDKLEDGTLSPEELANLELPYSYHLMEILKLQMGGGILMNQLALQEGIAIHIGGGFHHSFADHGEGFCALNDIAVGIRALQREGHVQKALVIDCDVHQGNGTAKIFGRDPSVFTFSIHQENNYPTPKEKSDLDIGLPDGTADEAYLDLLKSHIPKMLETFQPDFIVYDAGADPYERDKLGGLKLTIDGLKARDFYCLEQAKSRGIPIAVVLGGGYAPTVTETATIHANTVRAALHLYQPHETLIR